MAGTPEQSLESILQQLAAYSQTPSSITLPQENQINHSNTYEQYYAIPNAYASESHSSNLISTPQPITTQSSSVPQSSSSIEDHLRRLEEITKAGSASLKSQTYTPHVKPTQQAIIPILEWAQGLRYINRLSAQNPVLEETIKKMIVTQKANEESWWKGREAKKNEEDLKAWDMKVYKAQVAMNEHMEQQLRELGIPFFTIPSKLIFEDGEEQEIGKISQIELQTLQIRMLQYLKDMYE